MNKKSMKRLKYMVVISVFIICHLASAEGFTVAGAKNYPYRNLINRTDSVKVFYTTNDGEQSCRVEVFLNKMKWTLWEKPLTKIISTKISSLIVCLEKLQKRYFCKRFSSLGEVYNWMSNVCHYYFRRHDHFLIS